MEYTSEFNVVDCPLCKWFPKEEGENFGEIVVAVEEYSDYGKDTSEKTLNVCPECGVTFDPDKRKVFDANKRERRE